MSKGIPENVTLPSGTSVKSRACPSPRALRSPSRPSLIFSVNCIYRYLLFKDQGYLTDFLTGMSKLGPFVGYIGGGEQFNRQHVNQTMVCAVFD